MKRALLWCGSALFLPVTVQSFLEWLEGKKPPERDVAFEEDIPKLSMYHPFGARLLPAFLKCDYLTDSP
jgi:hypothetical protein